MSSQLEAKQSSHVKVAAASLIGTAIEWYDFFLYGTAAALIFNKLFFPTFDPMVGTLLAFATYALGFVARPLGGLVFGHYGDRIGRKTMLYLTLLIMNKEPDFEIPAEMRAMAEKSVAQAKQAFEGFMTAAQKAANLAEGQATTAHTAAKQASSMYDCIVPSRDDFAVFGFGGIPIGSDIALRALENHKRLVSGGDVFPMRIGPREMTLDNAE